MMGSDISYRIWIGGNEQGRMCSCGKERRLVQSWQIEMTELCVFLVSDYSFTFNVSKWHIQVLESDTFKFVSPKPKILSLLG